MDPQKTEETISTFLTEFWRDRTWQLEQTVIGVQISYPGEALYTSVLAQELHDLARAANGQMAATEDNRGEMHELCQKLAEWLFAAPVGTNHYEIPDYFADTPLGFLWWKALLWAEGDELVTIADAAKIAGVTPQAISQRVDRGTLRSFTDPTAPQRQARRLVRRRDVTP